MTRIFNQKLLVSSDIQILFRMQFVAMNAACDEEGINAISDCAGDIGAHGIANADDTLTRNGLAADFFCQHQSAFIDRRKWFSCLIDAPATLFIGLRNGARAIDELVADMHNEIGIGCMKASRSA